MVAADDGLGVPQARAGAWQRDGAVVAAAWFAGGRGCIGWQQSIYDAEVRGGVLFGNDDGGLQ